MSKLMVGIILAVNALSAHAVAPIEKETEGRIENLSIEIPTGSKFSEGRAVWYERAAKICRSEEFKVIHYKERAESYSDAVSPASPPTDESEAQVIPPTIFGIFQCP